MKTYWRTRINATTYRGLHGFSVTAWQVTETGTRVGGWPARHIHDDARARGAYPRGVIGTTH